MKTDNNKNKQMTKKEIKDLATQLLEQADVKEFGLTVTEDDLNYLSVKIVARMMNIQTMTEWYEHVSSSDIAEKVMDKQLNMTEEEDAIGNVARYMTLMNLFEEKEEYEKCAICKLKVDNVNKILKKY